MQVARVFEQDAPAFEPGAADFVRGAVAREAGTPAVPRAQLGDEPGLRNVAPGAPVMVRGQRMLEPDALVVAAPRAESLPPPPPHPRSPASTAAPHPAPPTVPPISDTAAVRAPTAAPGPEAFLPVVSQPAHAN